MGELANRAQQQSKFLLLEKGQSVIVQMVGFKFVPSNFDPEKEATRFTFKINGQEKYWTNGSGAIALALDLANPGDWIKITRSKKINKEGSEDTGKSVYQAVILAGYDPNTGQDTAREPIAPGKPIAAPKTATLKEDQETWEEDPFADGNT